MRTDQMLCKFVRDYPRLLVLSGAGISTGSGIPDYRDEHGQWKRRQPLTHQDFLHSEAARRRYWARSMMGWPLMANARPNAGHEALARLQALGYIESLVTQNVDGLHQRAGSSGVTELHGGLAQVVCLACGLRSSRAELQARLEAHNPHFRPAPAAAGAPDGDYDIEPQNLESFRVPACTACGGMLKPDVVFFGDSVPRERVTVTLAALTRAQAMLVVGSSLMVYSAYRFCLAAAQQGKPMAAITLGVTRADDLLQLKVRERCAGALARLASALEGGGSCDESRGKRD